MENVINNPIQIGENIHWIGAVDEDVSFHCNPYLLIDGDEAVLFDPGSMMNIDTVMKKLFSLVELSQIKYVVVTHQDPDLCASLPSLEKMAGANFKIVTHAKAAVLIKHYGISSEFYLVSRSLNDRKLTLDSGRVLKFYPAWFCHFPGAFVTYDSKSKILFSGDLFGGLSNQWTLFANDSYVDAMNAFHENYIPSNQILNLVLDQFADIPIDMIAPQHGSIIDKKVDFYIDALRSLQCGVDFLICPANRDETKTITDGDYAQLVQAVITRETSVLGEEKVAKVLANAGIEINAKGIATGDSYTLNDFERMINAFVAEFGPITLMYCRMKVQKIARELGLTLPKEFS